MATPNKQAALPELPTELICQILTSLPSSRDVASTALTSRKLARVVQAEGWRAHVQSKWPYTSTPPNWHQAAHAMATLEKNWRTRALLSRHVKPRGRIYSSLGEEDVGKEGKMERQKAWRMPKGQTMGFGPMIDSYEEWYGSSWADKSEVLAYSVGAELVVRLRRKGKDAQKRWTFANAEVKDREFDAFRHHTTFLTHRGKSKREGRDDIISVRLLRPHQKAAVGAGQKDSELVVLGYASGGLDLLEFRGGPSPSSRIVSSFATGTQDVRSAAISPGSNPFVAACLSDSKVALYPFSGNDSKIEPLASGVSALDEEIKTQRVWSTTFLSSSRLAVGLGPSRNPVRIFQVSPTGISPSHIRAFGNEDQLDNESALKTIYPVEPILQSQSAATDPGDLFLSGGYSGIVRLHDMRSPRDCEARIEDDIDPDSPIFSLCAVGENKFLAGGARHALIKIFDMRYLKRPTAEENIHTSPFNYNIFLRDGSNPMRTSRNRPRTHNSPVYTLSSPSYTSTSFFAGIEDSIAQTDFASPTDRHPDPVFNSSIVTRPSPSQAKSTTQAALVKEIDIKQSWDPRNEVMNLSTVEMGPWQSHMNEQVAIDTIGKWIEYNEVSRPGWDFRGLDQRWKSNTDRFQA
ncbi:hypothetical protein K402DRAFT_395847 [Aulographum hederae CBS 113979]|uniref:Uncharacterized protein n=1 Tax=Aulographum hederae CBS 113979 TaxID=1176131 RepID=A0A6G1GTB0_9PEZI|nr:hypothetical protein K402DRAFT_395847 [Aulographum hederae CBS 113979]